MGVRALHPLPRAGKGQNRAPAASILQKRVCPLEVNKEPVFKQAIGPGMRLQTGKHLLDLLNTGDFCQGKSPTSTREDFTGRSRAHLLSQHSQVPAPCQSQASLPARGLSVHTARFPGHPCQTDKRSKPLKPQTAPHFTDL